MRIDYRPLLWLIFFVSSASLAGGVRVLTANTTLQQNLFHLNAKIHYSLTKQQIQALHNGLPVLLVFRAEIRRKRLILDDSITKIKQKYILSYQALTQTYHIQNLNSGADSTYPRLNTALLALGNVSKHPLVDKSILNRQQRYKVRLRATTDVIGLPITVRAMHYFNDPWSRSSDWYTWTLPF